MRNIKNKNIAGKTWAGLVSCLAGAGLLSLSSCIDYDDVTREVSVDIQLVMPEEFTQGSDMEGHTVTISQLNGGNVLTATTNAQGVASFHGIIPDVYNVSTSWDITSEEYTQLTGDPIVNEGAVVSGNINSQLLSDDNTTTPLRLSTQLSINRSLVIGKIASSGCKDNNNKNYVADQYIELYNQSDKEIDVAGLYIGLVESNSKPSYTMEQLAESFNSDVVLLKQVFRIPLDADCKVAPGGTVVLANCAIDHTANAAASHNLLTADFDVNDTRPKNAYINNPDVRDMDLIYTFSSGLPYMNLMQGGPCGVVIFRTDENIDDWDLTYDYGKTKGNQWKVLPKKYIIDAVEILKNSSKGIDLATKRLYDDLDAGYTNIEAASGYTGEIMYRKTSSRRGKDGHKILQDTNNSTADFKVSTTIAIREYDE